VPDSARLQNLQVLVLEDEGGIAILLEDMLEDLGCRLAGSFARLEDAWAAISFARPEFALLDVNIAGEMSYDFARALAERGVPFVFSTGYGSRGLPSDLAGRRVLNKPYTQADLMRAIEAELDSRRGDGSVP
jgi:two-component SAPR family response regulator